MWVQGAGFPYSGFEFSGVEYQVSGFGVSGFGFRVQCFGFRGPGFGVRGQSIRGRGRRAKRIPHFLRLEENAEEQKEAGEIYWDSRPGLKVEGSESLGPGLRGWGSTLTWKQSGLAYRVTPLIRKRPTPGPYSMPTPRALWWSQGTLTLMLHDAYGRMQFARQFFW